MRVLVFGVFDLLHPGHRQLLKWVGQFGQVHVGLATDRYATEMKRRPVSTYEKREADLFGLVAAVHPKDQRSGRELVETVDPCLVAAGADRLGDLLTHLDLPVDYLKERGVGVMFYPTPVTVHTSDLVPWLMSSTS
jgi:cytidyltransferase-like protein